MKDWYKYLIGRPTAKAGPCPHCGGPVDRVHLLAYLPGSNRIRYACYACRDQPDGYCFGLWDLALNTCAWLRYFQKVWTSDDYAWLQTWVESDGRQVLDKLRASNHRMLQHLRLERGSAETVWGK